MKRQDQFLLPALTTAEKPTVAMATVATSSARVTSATFSSGTTTTKKTKSQRRSKCQPQRIAPNQFAIPAAPVVIPSDVFALPPRPEVASDPEPMDIDMVEDPAALAAPAPCRRLVHWGDNTSHEIRQDRFEWQHNMLHWYLMIKKRCTENEQGMWQDLKTAYRRGIYKADPKTGLGLDPRDCRGGLTVFADSHEEHLQLRKDVAQYLTDYRATAAAASQQQEESSPVVTPVTVEEESAPVVAVVPVPVPMDEEAQGVMWKKKKHPSPQPFLPLLHCSRPWMKSHKMLLSLPWMKTNRMLLSLLMKTNRMLLYCHG
jgi:hypothetical protein